MYHHRSIHLVLPCIALSAVSVFADDGRITGISARNPEVIEVTFPDTVAYTAGHGLSIIRGAGDEARYMGLVLVEEIRGNQIIGRTRGLTPEIGDNVRDIPLYNAFGKPQGQFLEHIAQATRLAAVVEAVENQSVSIFFANRQRYAAERTLAMHIAGKEQRDADVRVAEANAAAATSLARTRDAIERRDRAEADKVRAEEAVEALRMEVTRRRTEVTRIEGQIAMLEEEARKARERFTKANEMLGKVKGAVDEWTRLRNENRTTEQIEAIVKAAANPDEFDFLGVSLRDLAPDSD